MWWLFGMAYGGSLESCVPEKFLHPKSLSEYCSIKDLKRQSSEILIPFFDTSEEEPLLIKKIFRGPHDFRSKKLFFTRLRRIPFGKIIFFGKFA